MSKFTVIWMKKKILMWRKFEKKKLFGKRKRRKNRIIEKEKSAYSGIWTKFCNEFSYILVPLRRSCVFDTVYCNNYGPHLQNSNSQGEKDFKYWIRATQSECCNRVQMIYYPSINQNTQKYHTFAGLSATWLKFVMINNNKREFPVYKKRREFGLSTKIARLG